MSSEGLMEKFDEIVKRFKEEFNEIIESERSKMKAEVEAYEAEKQRMNAVQVSDDDIIQLNVAGQKFTTNRSTLCQVEGSLLASMFSGRWEDGISRDKDGCVFLDFNPQYFAFILEYLRAKKIASPENPAAMPSVAEDQAKNFNTLVEYLGLGDEIFPNEIVSGDIFKSHGEDITLEESGKVAVHTQKPNFDYVLGENVYQQEIKRIKLKLESFGTINGWMFVGIAKADAVQENSNCSYAWGGSYGWALGIYGELWKAGTCTVENTLKNISKQGDTVELVLDCDAAKLSLHLPTGQQFHIDIPKSQTWRLHVNLSCANDKIRII